MAVRITCIEKDNGNHENPYEAIAEFGWLNEQTGKRGTSDRETMYDWVTNRKGVAYVKDIYGNIVNVYGATSRFGNHYLRTYRDGKWTDNLLALMECSVK